MLMLTICKQINLSTSSRDMKGTGWNGSLVKEKNERLAERVELLEELVKKMSAIEGKPCRVNPVQHLN